MKPTPCARGGLLRVLGLQHGYRWFGLVWTQRQMYAAIFLSAALTCTASAYDFQR